MLNGHKELLCILLLPDVRQSLQPLRMQHNVLRLWPDASEAAAKRSEATLANSFKALGSSPSESVALLEHDGRCGGSRGGREPRCLIKLSG